MLKIKVNKKDCKQSYSELVGATIQSTGSTDAYDMVIKCQNHGLKENDIVEFSRKDGNIGYYESYDVKSVTSNSTFSITTEGKLQLNVVGYKPTWIGYSDKIYENNYFTELTVQNSSDKVNLFGSELNRGKITPQYRNELLSIKISSIVNTIAEDTFIDCVNLESIEVEENNKYFSSVDGVLYNKDKTVLIQLPQNYQSSYYSTPDTVKEIGDYAFYNCTQLSLVSLHHNVNKIGKHSFENCVELKHIICRAAIPPQYDGNVFDTTSDELKIYVPKNKEVVYRKNWRKYRNNINSDVTVFYYTNDFMITDAQVIDTGIDEDLIGVEFGTSVIEIDENELPTVNNVLFTGRAPISVRQSIFGENKRYPIFVPGEYFDEYKIILEDYGSRVMTEKDLKGKTILHTTDNGLILLTGDTLYSGISDEYKHILKSVEISDDVVRIDDRAFYYCEHLRTVNIPDSVKSIGDYAFYGCSSLSKIILGLRLDIIGVSAFYNTTNSVVNLYTETPTPPFLKNCEMFPSGIKIFAPMSCINDYTGIYMKPTISGGATQKQYLCLNIEGNHVYTINMGDIKIKREYTWVGGTGGTYTYSGAITTCNGDYYLYDDLFLGQNNEGSIDVLNIDYLNITAVTNNGDLICLSDCLIGVTSEGVDDLSHIYVPYLNNETFINSIEDDFDFYKFFGDDVRFVYGSNRMSYGKTLQPGTIIQKLCGDIEVDFGMAQNFDVNLLHEEQINNYVDEIKENSINKIIDYERYQFTPMYYSGKMSLGDKTVDQYLQEHVNEIDDNLKEVSEIRFRLNFREKVYNLYDENGNIVLDSGDAESIDTIDFGSWETSDYGYWNNYVLNDNLKRLRQVYVDKKVHADLLGYIGYTDDDVYYQKDALKKSFLRLSFYDSPNRETQKLLYYSTVYFDTNSLNEKYIKDLNIWRENSGYTPTYGQLVFDGNIATVPNTHGEAITAEMSCTDKYDDTLSSDGFYIHLFDKLVSGNTCTPIYMKAEFNHAKFGKVVPMIYPTFKSDNKPIAATNESFPREYIKYGKNTDVGSGYTWIDMESLIKDSYIKIYIKYNFKTHNYVWFLPRTGDGSVLKFDLFEPRLNGYDPESYFAMQGKDRGYGTDDGRPKWYQGEFVRTGYGIYNYTWYRTIDGDSNKYSEFGGGVTTKWPGNDNCTCLMTTAVTLNSDSMLQGTKIFNKKSMSKIKSIWIDGMMVYSDEFYDENTEEYNTNVFQLPDVPFSAPYLDNNTQETGFFEWNPTTIRETWDDQKGVWVKNGEGVKPKKIHSVNYYFKTNTSDSYELLDELYKGVYNTKKQSYIAKTIEATSDYVDTLKNSIEIRNGEKLPNGMFANLRSLKSVKTVKNGTKYFTTIGDGAFNNCQALTNVDIEKDSVDIIGKNCFSGCRALKTAKLTNVKVILREAFQGCYTLMRTYYTVGPEAKTKYIACGAFGYTKIREIPIPHSLIRISNSAFRRCYQLNSFIIAEKGDVQWDYFYGPNTYYDTERGAMVFGDPDLYTFYTPESQYQCRLASVGKRVFGDDAILKYNISITTRKDGKKPLYDYYKCTPTILNKFIDKGVYIEFYNAAMSRWTELQLTTEKDRGKMFYHFKDKEYREYLDEKRYDVYNFRDWFRYIF